MELLVVIAIIGILASVVLASLNTARSKGSDAAVKSSLNNARAQAELYYDSNANSYAPTAPSSYPATGVGVCSTAAGILNMVTGADNANGTALGAACNASASAWAAAAGLQASSTATYYCVDSTGVSKTNTGAVSALGALYACP